MATEQPVQQDAFKLPIELKTVLRSLQRKLGIFILLAILSAAAGVAGALYLGSQYYESTTVLFYQPIESFIPDTFRVYQSMGESTQLTYEQGAGLVKFESSEKSLWNRVNMVKTLPNLEMLRKQLQLEKTLEQLGSAIRVTVARDTNLMSITSKGDTAQEAALIANTIRDIFLEQDNNRVRSELTQKIDNLQKQYEEAMRELKAAKDEFDTYVREYDIKDIQIDSAKYASEMIDLEISLAKNRDLISSYKQRIAKIQIAIETANRLDEEAQKALEEQEEQRLGLTPDEANNKIQQLTQRIEEIKNSIVFPIETEQLKTQLIIAENEYVRGLITRREYEEAKFAYESFIEKNKPSLEIDRLRDQIEEIRNMTFVGRGDSVASSEYLKLVRVMLLENELELISISSQQQADQDRYSYLREKNLQLPTITQRYIILTGLVASLEAETRGLIKILNQYRMITEKEQSDFYIINDALLPLYPRDSNRKLLAIAICFVFFLMGFTLILLKIVTDTRVKSPGDAKQKLQKTILGVFPLVKDQKSLIPTASEESVHIEYYRMLCRLLRRSYTHQGATFLITSSGKKEGKSTVALNLATVFGRQDEHVLLIDAQVRKRTETSCFSQYIEPEQETLGLGDYLSYKASDSNQIIKQTSLAGVDMLLTHSEAVIPDLLQSSRMRELLSELKQQYSIIIIEGSHILESVDSEILTSYADTTLLVVACDMYKQQVIKQCLKRLEKTDIPTEGIILTKASPIFLK